MSVFASQFDRARPYSAAYAGPVDDPGWRTPVAAAALVAGAGLALVAASAVADGEGGGGEGGGGEGGGAGDGGGGGGWGDGWDAGWEAHTPEPVAGDSGDAWSHRGDYTDASVGGDDGFFYFIDGDSSLTLG